jgi:hypothetical protein
MVFDKSRDLHGINESIIAESMQECCSRWWVSFHYVSEREMYTLHAAVVAGLDGNGLLPSEQGIL